jgi:antiviral helicase SLH1
MDTNHLYTKKTVSRLLSISRANLDHSLPREVHSRPTALIQFLRVWDQFPRLRVSESRPTPQSIRVNVRRLNRAERNLIYAPKFPKPQQESWFVAASDESSRKLLSLQRLTLSSGNGYVALEIPADVTAETIMVRVLSDGWRGVDFEKSISWNTPRTEIDAK